MEWEGSKENVRPLRQGRDNAVLEKALDSAQPVATKEMERAGRRRCVILRRVPAPFAFLQRSRLLDAVPQERTPLQFVDDYP